MIRLWQRLLDPAYLYAIDPGPLGRWKWIYVAWAALLLAGAGVALAGVRRSRERTWRGTAAVVLAACIAGLIFLGLRFLIPWADRLPPYTRFLLIEAWTARIWPLSATAVALLALPVGLLAHRRLPLLQRHIDALCGALQTDDPALSLGQQSLLLLLHLLGLAGLWYQAGRPAWWAIPTLAVLCALPLLACPHHPRLETLTPLLPAYLGGVLWAALRRLDLDPAAYAGYALPDLWSPWFNVPALLLAGGGYVLWIQARLVLGRKRRLLAPVTGVAVLCWLVVTVAVHRTHGVTASDPYCYVQMAIDLAQNGSALHRFPLAGLARDLALPTWPAVHIGYHPPDMENRAATMWPIGWPLLMVPFYRLGGLDLVYLAAPVVAVLALVVTWFMAQEALYGEGRRVRWAVAALTCLLVATSPEGSERLLVPMADAAAQFLSMSSLWLLLRALRSKPLAHGVLAGMALGGAYLVRHPQLPLAAAALAAAAVLWPTTNRSRSTWPAWLRHPLYGRMGLPVAFGLGALVLAVPDLLYHARAFGHWLHTESSEWFLISPQFIGRSLFGVVEQGLLRREELGFIAPLVLYGGWRLWRRRRNSALILGTGLTAVSIFHLLYAALRPRDLIAVLPVLYLCAAYGLVSLWRRLARRRTPGAALLLFCMALLLGVRSYRTLAMPWRLDVITFGHVSATQRRALEALAELTPDDAVVGSMLNGGAIELHARRSAVHPAPWTEDELYAWIEALQAQGRACYMLDDGEEMAAVLARIEARYTLRRVQALELPYFALGGGNLPRKAVLYRVE